MEAAGRKHRHRFLNLLYDSYLDVISLYRWYYYQSILTKLSYLLYYVSYKLAILLFLSLYYNISLCVARPSYGACPSELGRPLLSTLSDT